MELQRGYGDFLAFVEEAECEVRRTDMIMPTRLGDRFRERGDAVVREKSGYQKLIRATQGVVWPKQ